MAERSRLLRSISGVLVMTLLLACGFSVLAQSGRRSPPPSPIPTATPERLPTSSAKDTENETTTVKLILGVDRYSDVSDIPSYFYSSVRDSCAGRLDDAKSVEVIPTTENMSRSDAAHRAKKEKDAYVVMLELRSTSTRVGTQMTRDLNDVYIEYLVFAPVSAKVVAKGKAFQRKQSLGGVLTRQPTGRNTIADHDHWLKQAARDAAEDILASFRIRPPKGPIALSFPLPFGKAIKGKA